MEQVWDGSFVEEAIGVVIGSLATRACVYGK